MTSTATVLRRVSLDIEGMTCNACVARLEKAFARTSGVETASVNLPLEKATLVFDTKVIQFSDLKEIVERTGFDVGTQSRVYFVDGMTVGEDVAIIEAAINNVPGVTSSEVNFSEERIRISFIAHSVTDDVLKTAVEKAGFKLVASSVEQAERQDTERVDDRERTLLIAACLICVPFLVQMVAQFVGWDWIHMMPAAEVVLATAIQIVIGARFYRSAYNALRGGSANMDVLVVLGTSAAYLFSWYTMLQLGEAAEGELYFEASALILTFVLLGKRLEHRAKRATTAAIRQLMDLRSRTVRIQNEAGDWEQRPISELTRGMSFELRPGDRVSADGVVREGVTTTDESLLTGESSPVTKSIGDAVYEGSINIDGRVVVETTAFGEEGTLGRIARSIESAQTGKIAVERLVDRVSAFFVPIVLGIALAVCTGWLISGSTFEMALINAVSVLVIACPCALGLATPTAVITGTGAAARAGILFRDIQCIEMAQRVTVVAFDKTGTVTNSDPTVVTVLPMKGQDLERVIHIAGSIQANSEHPIASAFVNRLKGMGEPLLEVSEFKSYVAEGVEGRVGRKIYYVGNRKLLDRVGISYDSADVEDVVYLFDSNTVLARFGIQDEVRPNARPAIEAIHKQRMTTVILSGDAENKTKKVAESIGVGDFKSRLTPEDKVREIEDYIAEGHVVAMVGDGVNDAPALARADVGIAMSSGTDASIEAAPVTLMRNDLSLISSTFQASRVTFRKIKQNLFWAFIYNVVMLPLAAFGFLTPTIAGGAMALSSVSVVCNSLLLKTWKPRNSP